MGLVGRILAAGICGAEMNDAGQPVALHPDEEILVAKAAAKRRRDFALENTWKQRAAGAWSEIEQCLGAL